MACSPQICTQHPNTLPYSILNTLVSMSNICGHYNTPLLYSQHPNVHVMSGVYDTGVDTMAYSPLIFL